MIADLLVEEFPAAPLGVRRFNTYFASERRRIVAQVRRKLLKNRDFFAVRDSARWCDDLLTTPLTMPIGRAYKPPTERGAVLALGQGMFSCP